jgi:acyl phosphate:glycerol-3-phosphate acyltransferase
MTPTAMLTLAMLLSYLLGSLAGSLLVGRFRGVDIREFGSGNAGATNALRTQGLLFALLTILIDTSKGMLAVLVVAKLAEGFSYAAHACAFAVVLGHCFPIFYGFRGGKGAATAFGAFVVLLPHSAGLALLVWLLTLVATGYVGFSTVLCALAGIVALGWIEPGLAPAARWWASACFALVALKHNGNIARMIDGTENRFQRVRLLHRWFGKRAP